MFTTPCFIRKNTPELREGLEKLGYIPRPKRYTTEKYLEVYRDGCYTLIEGDEYGLHLFVDCGDNEEMFLALAALRDDTDKDQWFTDGTDWAIWREDSSFRGKLIVGFEFHYLPSNTNYNKYHKATAEEIIEHFTMKGDAE